MEFLRTGDMLTLNWKKVLELVANPGARVQNGVQVVMVLAVAYSAAQLTWRALPEPEMGAAPVPVFDGAGAQSAAPKSNAAAQIPNWHLFGEVQLTPQVVEQPKAVDLPETNLRLTLRGVIASPDPGQARAIVADSSGNENFYKINDKLPGNAVLKEVHADRIVIQRGSRFETLKLPKEQLTLETQVEEQPAFRPTPRSNFGRGSSPVAAAPVEPVESLGQVRDVLMKDPMRLADVVRISPKRENGSFLGYELQPGRDANFMARYGLMPGDIVVSINGTALDSPAKGFGLMRELQSAEMLDIEVDRNGSRQRFSLPID